MFAKDLGNTIPHVVTNNGSIQKEVLLGQMQPQAQREIPSTHPASCFLLYSGGDFLPGPRTRHPGGSCGHTRPPFPARRLISKGLDVARFPHVTPRSHRDVPLTATWPPSSLRNRRTSRRAASAHCLQKRKYRVSPAPDPGCRRATDQRHILPRIRGPSPWGPFSSQGLSFLRSFSVLLLTLLL